MKRKRRRKKGQGSSGDEPAGAEAAAPAYEVEMHPWDKPLYLMIFALADMDHLRDAHLLLLVFYLHHLIEGEPLPILFSAVKLILILMHVGALRARAAHPPPMPRRAFTRCTPPPPLSLPHSRLRIRLVGR
ncbi:hypothetical protein FB451DRAFT_1396585 [Mycena latifolia]|nr:hypothetical protein FB451DRAFT_1396585 [Mycena latifolia]